MKAAPLENGKVAFSNANTGQFAIELTDGTYTLVELLDGGSVSVGSELIGCFRSFGEETLKDKTTELVWEVFVIAYELSSEAAERATR